MNKYTTNQSGFGLIEALLIILIVAVIGFGGYYVWHTNHKTKSVNATATTTKTSASSSKAAANSYAGWSTATLANEKLTFRYPSDWKLADSNAQNGTNDGSDNVGITSPDGVQVNVSTDNMEHPSSDGPQTIAYADPATFLGKKAYIVYSTNTTSASDPISQGAVSFSSTDFPSYNANPLSSPDYLKTRNMNPQGWLLIDITVPADSSIYKSNIVSDKDYIDAKLIVESMHY